MRPMSGQPQLAIIWHSRTGASEALARAASQADGAVLVRARDVEPSTLCEAAAYLFVCPENLGGLSGEMKEMFDRTYYPMLGQIEGRPYATIIAAGSDGEGAQRQLDRIVTGWRLKRVADPLIVNFDAQTPEAILAKKTVHKEQLEASLEMAKGLSEGLNLGIF